MREHNEWSSTTNCLPDFAFDTNDNSMRCNLGFPNKRRRSCSRKCSKVKSRVTLLTKPNTSSARSATPPDRHTPQRNPPASPHPPIPPERAHLHHGQTAANHKPYRIVREHYKSRLKLNQRSFHAVRASTTSHDLPQGRRGLRMARNGRQDPFAAIGGSIQRARKDGANRAESTPRQTDRWVLQRRGATRRLLAYVMGASECVWLWRAQGLVLCERRKGKERKKTTDWLHLPLIHPSGSFIFWMNSITSIHVLHSSILNKLFYCNVSKGSIQTRVLLDPLLGPYLY